MIRTTDRNSMTEALESAYMNGIASIYGAQHFYYRQLLSVHIKYTHYNQFTVLAPEQSNFQCEMCGLISVTHSLSTDTPKQDCRRTAPVEQFAGYSKTDQQLRTV